MDWEDWMRMFTFTALMIGAVQGYRRMPPEQREKLWSKRDVLLSLPVFALYFAICFLWIYWAVAVEPPILIIVVSMLIVLIGGLFLAMKTVRLVHRRFGSKRGVKSDAGPEQGPIV